MNKLLFIFALSFSLAIGGCALDPYHKLNVAIARYQAVAPSVHLGQTREQVAAALEPTQEGLPAGTKRLPESFKEGNDTVEVLFCLSSYGGGRDESYTPYVFRNGALVAIGWSTLGGPKGQAPAEGVQVPVIVPVYTPTPAPAAVPPPHSHR